MSSFPNLPRKLFQALYQGPISEKSYTTDDYLNKTTMHIKSLIPEDIHLLFKPSHMLNTSDDDLLISVRDRISIINPASKKSLSDLKASVSQITALAYKTNLFYGDAQGQITSFHIDTKKEELKLKVHEGAINILKISEELLYSVSGGTVRVTDLVSHNSKQVFESPMDIVCFDLLGNNIIAAGEKILLLLNPPIEIQTKFPVTAVACATDYFIVGLTSGRLVFYQYSLGTSENLPFKEYKGHKAAVHCILIYKDIIISGGADDVIRIWNINGIQIKLTTTQDSQISQLVIVKGIIYSSTKTAKILAWKIPDFEKIQLIPNENPVKKMIASGDLLGVHTENDVISLWSLQNYEKLGELIHSSLKCFTFSEDSLHILAAYDSELLKWDLRTFTYEAFKITITAISIFCDKTYIILGSIDGKIRIYDYKLPAHTIHKITLHEFAIKNLCMCRHRLFSSSMNSEISCFNLKERIIDFTLPHSTPILSLTSSDSQKYLISAGVSEIKIWSIKIKSCIRTISIPKGHIHSVFALNGLAYICSSKRVTVVDQRSWDIKARFKNNSSSMAITEEQWTSVANNTITVRKNPMTNQEIMVYGDSTRIYNSLMNVWNLITNRKLLNTKSADYFFISPYKLNIAHICALRNLSEMLDLSLQHQAPYALTWNKETPLSISMSRDFTSCVVVVLKSISKRLKENPYFFVRSKETLVDLNMRGDKSLIDFYQSLLYQDKSMHLPKFCSDSEELPKLKYKKSFECMYNETKYKSENIPNDKYANKKPILFYHSVVKLPQTGSQQSLNLMESITRCPNSEIFRSDFIDLLLQTKWQEVRMYLYFQASLFLIYLILISVYTVFFMNARSFLFPIFFMNLIFLGYEIFQMYAGRRLYWEDIWNYLDISRCILVVCYCFFNFTNEISDSDRGSVLVVINLLSWIRGINYFRLFHNTRTMVNLIKEACQDIISFLIIYWYLNIAFGFIYFALESAESDMITDYIVEAYKLTFADYDTTEYDLLEWIVFFISTMANTLIMLNLLICILFDTYDKVKALSVIADRKEIAQLVLEGEVTMFFNRNSERKKRYLHAALGQEIEKDVDPVEVRLKSIKRDVRKVVGYAREVKENSDDTNQKVKELEKKINDMNDALIRIEGKLGS